MVPLLAVMAAAGPPLRAAEMVTIPKSRLEELEHKEAELDKLKAELRARNSGWKARGHGYRPSRRN